MPDEHETSLVTAFRNDARAYCDLIDAWQAGAIEPPYTALLESLSALAKSGPALPNGTTEYADVVERMTHEQWCELAAFIRNAAAPAVSGLQKKHADDEANLIRASMMDDDLADIYRDLRHGLDLYAGGDADQQADAV